jgi:hypothetical protein
LVIEISLQNETSIRILGKYTDISQRDITVMTNLAIIGGISKPSIGHVTHLNKFSKRKQSAKQKSKVPILRKGQGMYAIQQTFQMLRKVR